MSVVAERSVAAAAGWSPSGTTEPGPRLIWATAVGGYLDGAWWPRSDAADPELRELLPAVGAHLGGPVFRVSLNIDAWGAEQPRRLRLPDHLVRLGWFRTLDPAVVTLGRSTRERITLLVVPSTLSAGDGETVMRRLAAETVWPDTASAAINGSAGS
jgi:hypothetical protein